MSMQSYHERKEPGKQPIHSYQAAWMGHWSRTRAVNNLLVDHKPIEGSSIPAATNAYNHGNKEFTELPFAGLTSFPDESANLVSQLSRKDRLEHGQPFPMFGLSRNRDKGILTIKDDQASPFDGQRLGPNSKGGLDASLGDPVKRRKMSLWAAPGYEAESREHIFDLGGTSRDFIEKKSLVVSASIKDDFSASSSRYPIGSSAVGRLGKVNGTSSFLTAKGHFMNRTLTKLEPDQCHHGSSPVTSEKQLTLFHGSDEYQKNLKSCSGNRFFQSHIAEVECPSRPWNSFVDVETLRICTTTDSEKGFKFYGTMKELFLTEKETKTNLSRGGTLIRESTISTTAQFKENIGVLGLSRNGGFKSRNQGVKLQPLWSSTDSEEKDNAVDLKDESSAETNTMDMDTLKVDQPCGDEVSLRNKKYVGLTRLSLPSQGAAWFTSEGSSSRENADKPGTHLNYLALPSAISSSTENKEPSTSKTQSLDVPLLLHEASFPTATISKSRSAQSVPDPESRWVKRLKISTSESYGSKTSKMESLSVSPKKFNPFLGKALKRVITSSEMFINESCEKKQIMFDLNERLVIKDGGPCSTSENLGKSRDELLSHSWIRRWCRAYSQNHRKQAEVEAGSAFVFCEPQSLKASLDVKKQFPSIAAIALMGKAMNGFRPCEFEKRGSFVVWNTK